MIEMEAQDDETLLVPPAPEPDGAAFEPTTDSQARRWLLPPRGRLLPAALGL